MDRRFALAIILMLVVFIVPPMLIERRPRAPVPAPVQPVPPPAAAVQPEAPVLRAPEADSAAPTAEDTVEVRSELYRYRFSTRGGRLIEATFAEYRSMRPEERSAPAQIIAPGSQFQALGLLLGNDTIRMRDLAFRPSSQRVEVGTGATTLSWTAARDSALGVELQYTFTPADYRIAVEGRVSGLGATGATLLVAMGPGPRNTESDSVEHSRELAVVTKNIRSELTSFAELDPGVAQTLPGPFDWVAVKNKYFVTAVIAADTAGRTTGRLSGVQLTATDRQHRTPEAADVWASLGLSADGRFKYSLYVGPMEYPRLRSIGHGFDDINPYGWAWLRPVIRPVAVGARWLLVAMHEKAGIAYGLGLVIFGVLIRLVLWPLNQKAMRASMAMQAIQPVLKEIQEKYQSDPQRLQQEMFKVYKENKVNPFSGCWPLLLPWPVMIALFFVFQNSIELRGQSFLWIPDLSRPDPIYVIPVLMAVSMYGVTKIGQLGLPPNPQMKMMLYLMPAMMLVLFLNFASGLNLYYAVQNIASIPQQWMVAQERLRKQPAQPPPRPSTPAPAPKTGKSAKR
jgi:YidC/Oxa1 family membrane protein insertase